MSFLGGLLTLLAGLASLDPALAKDLNTGLNPQEAVNLIIWQPSAKHPKWIIPKLKGESAFLAAQRYLEASQGDLDARGLVPSSDFSPMAEWKFKALSAVKNPLVSVIANREADHSAGEARIESVQDFLEARSVDMALVPVGATLRLSNFQREQFNRSLAQRAKGLILLGGADLAPALYGQDPTHAILFNEKFDRLEMQLTESYLQHGQGPIMGICRGSQLLAVTLGGSIIQHIAAFHPGALFHGRGEGGIPSFHPLIFQATEHNYIAQGLGVSRSAFGTSSTFIANSSHHQAVAIKAGGALQIAATSEDGITELFESRDGRVIGIQSHPETHDPSGLGAKVFDYFSNQVKQNSCEGLLSVAG